MLFAIKIVGKVLVWVVFAVLACVLLIVDIRAYFHHKLAEHPRPCLHGVARRVEEVLRDVPVGGNLPPDDVQIKLIRFPWRCKILSCSSFLALILFFFFLRSFFFI